MKKYKTLKFSDSGQIPPATHFSTDQPMCLLPVGYGYFDNSYQLSFSKEQNQGYHGNEVCGKNDQIYTMHDMQL